MDALCIGSLALREQGFRLRKAPSDIDIIARPDAFEKFVECNRKRGTLEHLEYLTDSKAVARLRAMSIPYEFELAWPGSTGDKLLGLVDHWGLYHRDNDQYYADPSVILALKLSHRYLKNSPHFLKTMEDIYELRGMGIVVGTELKEWLKEREKATYTYKHPSLERNKEKFFTPEEKVPYKYEHDDIHKAVAIWGYPAYTYFQRDGAEVSVDKKRWDECSFDIKIASVIEESCVLALERCLIPNDFKIPPRRAFLMALQKVCTSISSGWWREFAWEHYYQAVGRYSDSYVQAFHSALRADLIRPYQGQKEMV